MKTPLRIALIGCGALAHNFYKPSIEALRESHSLEVRALADVNVEAALRLQKTFPSARVLQSLDRLEASSIDFAIVASPPQHHSQAVKLLLEKNISVLCEKPLALNWAEAKSMLDTASRSTALFAVGFMRRFCPAFHALGHFLKHETFGKAQFFSWHEGKPFSWPIQSSSLFEKALGNRGVLQDLGVHGLDLILQWFGYPLGFACQHDACGGVETNALLHLSFGGGVEGDLRLSWDSPLRNTLEIQFEKAKIIWPLEQASTLNIHLKDLPFVLENKVQHNFSHYPLEKNTVFSDGYSSCFVAQLAHVCDAIRGETLLKVEASSALDVTRLIDEAYHTAGPMPQPWINLEDTSPC